MDSVKLAARCYNKGLLGKEAFEDVPQIRERLIKQAIARKVTGVFVGRASGKSGAFFGGMKKSLLGGGQAKVGKECTVRQLHWNDAVGNLVKLLAAGAALQGGASAYSGLTMRRKDKAMKGRIKESYGKMLKEYPDLGDLDKGKVSRHFGVLARYAPSLAADPLVAGSWVKSTAGMGYIDPDAIKRLSDTQSSIDKTHEGRSLIRPGEFGKSIQLAQSAMS